MSTKTVATEVASETKEKSQEVEAPKESKRKTITNWRVLEQGGFIPARMKCEAYRAPYPADQSCHTNINPTIKDVLRHMDPNHGGGWFKLRLRISDSKEHPLWRELENAGVEIQEFWCPHCRKDVSMTPRQIQYHLQNHPGALRNNFEPQTLCMWLTFNRPDEAESEELYMHDGDE